MDASQRKETKEPHGVDRLRGVRGEEEGEGYIGQQARRAGLQMLDRPDRMFGFYLVGYRKPEDLGEEKRGNMEGSSKEALGRRKPCGKVTA